MFRMFVLLGLAIVVLASGAFPLAMRAARKATYVTVSAGAFERRDTVVSFSLPLELRGKADLLFDTSTRDYLPLQIDANGTATFVLPFLKSGGTATFRLERASNIRRMKLLTPAVVTVVDEGKRLTVQSWGKPVLSFLTKAELPSPEIKPIFLRAGYIHPVYTPSGVIVTDDFPPDHYHHHGIWAAWTKTAFEGRHPDFWNVGDGTGKVDFVAVDRTWNGVVHAGFRSRQRYVDVSGSAPVTALNETWEVVVYRGSRGNRPYSMFDLISTQQTASSSTLGLDEYRYGGVGLRGSREWKDKSKVFFLTSEGKDRANGNATSGRWFHMGGPVGGRVVGIATFDHPSNFRSPQRMRLNPDDPFFNWAPSQSGPFEIKAGDQFVLRYRFVVADGPPDKTELERLWNDFATPPQVSITSR